MIISGESEFVAIQTYDAVHYSDHREDEHHLFYLGGSSAFWFGRKSYLDIAIQTSRWRKSVV